MHGDHSFGLVPFLCSLADGTGGVLEGSDPRDFEAAASPPVDIYGLTGTRRLVRTMLECTYTRLARQYRVHELLLPEDTPYGGRRHYNELPGQDILFDEKRGCWPNFLRSDGPMPGASAVPIKHTVPCVGYIFEEPPRPGSVDAKTIGPLLQKNKAALAGPPFNLDNPMKLLAQLKNAHEPITLPDGTVLHPPAQTKGRKIVVLGDTYDAESSAMDGLATHADLLVHEATNAFLPDFSTDGRSDEETYEQVEQKAKSHGHSTPQVAGRFAKRIQTRHLFLNHFSNRYPDSVSPLVLGANEKHELAEGLTLVNTGDDEVLRRSGNPREVNAFRRSVIEAIERQASDAWGSGRRAFATRDQMTVALKARKEPVTGEGGEA